jgi:hypothetical protein
MSAEVDTKKRQYVVEEILSAPWAREGARQIDQVLLEMNTVPQWESVRIVWGYADHEQAAWERIAPEGPAQGGLLSYRGHDLELRFWQQGENPARPLLAEVTALLPDAVDLPRDTESFCQVLAQLEDGVQVLVNRADLVAFGVISWVYLEGLNGRILREVLDRLVLSAARVFNLLWREDQATAAPQEGLSRGREPEPGRLPPGPRSDDTSAEPAPASPVVPTNPEERPERQEQVGGVATPQDGEPLQP